MNILIGSDPNGYVLKEDLKQYLTDLGHHVIDIGCAGAQDPTEYPDIAEALALRIAAAETDRGILICGTGLGMAIAANKIPGVRAATCHDPYSAERARKSNNAQIMTMGAQIVAPTLAHLLVDHWLASEYHGGRSTSKVQKVDDIDRRYHTSELES